MKQRLEVCVPRVRPNARRRLPTMVPVDSRIRPYSTADSLSCTVPAYMPAYLAYTGCSMCARALSVTNEQ